MLVLQHFTVYLIIMWWIGYDGKVIATLSPMSYTLIVEATAVDNPQQTASDIVGPITLTGGSATCEYNIALTVLCT